MTVATKIETFISLTLTQEVTWRPCPQTRRSLGDPGGHSGTQAVRWEPRLQPGQSLSNPGSDLGSHPEIQSLTQEDGDPGSISFPLASASTRSQVPSSQVRAENPQTQAVKTHSGPRLTGTISGTLSRLQLA